MRRIYSLGLAVLAVAFLFTSLGVGCSSSTDVGPSASPDELFEQGPFEVGYREMTITYSAAASMEPRELVLRVWYPAQSDSGAGPAQYAVGGVIDLPSPFALDAPPVIEENDLPLVIHSHGNGGKACSRIPTGS